MQIFVTGVYASGKTSLAKKIAAEKMTNYISFDDLYDYQLQEDQYDKIAKILTNNFVIDAIPFNQGIKGTNWDSFFRDQAVNGYEVICCYCPSESEWIDRVNQKEATIPVPVTHGPKESLGLRLKRLSGAKAIFEALVRRVKNFLYRIQNLMQRVKESVHVWAITNFTEEGKTPPQFPRSLIDEHFSEYRLFYLEYLPILEKMCDVKYYDTLANEYTSLEELRKRMNLPLLTLKERIYKHEYDTYYQDIEILKVIGYSRSLLTWKRLKNITTWAGKTVLDVGCFHGYFSFKIEESGALKVIGLEKSGTVLKTTRLLAEIIGSQAEFYEWTGGDDYPDCDIILFLNVIHHFGDREMQRKALAKIKAGTEVIFEINKDQIPLIKELFTIKRSMSSHRKNRVVCLAAKSS
jgi:2-polyprenyl-3-methyl-5-hydroxy-6-metoxy-1,4-benzoquinol methylase